MRKIGSISSGSVYAPTDAGAPVNQQNNNLYREKLTFKPGELNLGGKRPATVELSERQIETKLFQKHGFNPNNPTQLETLKRRFDTRQSPYSEINWGKGKFVAKLNDAGQYEITVGLRGRTVEALQGRSIPAPTGSGASSINPNDAVAAKRIIDDSSQRAALQAKADAASTEGLTPEQKDLVLDLTQVGLSVVGIFDPTGIADGADAAICLGRGDYWGAGISALGIIPYLGDLAKIGKLPKLLKIVEKTVEMAKVDGKFAKVVEPMLKGLKNALDNLPIHKLPNWAKEPIEKLSTKIDEFFKVRKAGKLTIEAGRTLSASEQKIANKLIAEGKSVKARVESTVKGVKNPDFEVDGVITEFKHVSDLKGIDAERLSKGLSGRILDGASQAKHIILDVADQPGMSREITERAVARAYGRLRQLGSDAVTQVRIIGKDFDVTIPFTISK